jgi:hypothetical protein
VSVFGFFYIATIIWGGMINDKLKRISIWHGLIKTLYWPLLTGNKENQKSWLTGRDLN